MMKTFRTLVTATVLSSTLFAATAANAQDAQPCQPGLGAAFAAHQPSYTSLI